MIFLTTVIWIIWIESFLKSKKLINTLSFRHIVNVCLDVLVELCQAAVNVFDHIAHVGEFVETFKVILVLFAFFVTLGHFFVQILAKEVVTERDYEAAAVN